jgi:uncharacterized protein
MMTDKPLMPKATAVWLVDNTSLTFEQIADFCGLHELEVKGIADGQVAQGIKGMDPISTGQLTREEITKAQEDPGYRMTLAKSSVQVPETKTKRRPKYTPVSRRHDRPNAIYWLLRNHPELRDSQIMRLVGTTKPTIQTIRDRTHWNMTNLQPQDPVTLGLCKQMDLDAEVQKAAKRAEADKAETAIASPDASLKPIEDAPLRSEQPDNSAQPEKPDADVFSTLEGEGSAAQDDENAEELAERAFANFEPSEAAEDGKR